MLGSSSLHRLLRIILCVSLAYVVSLPCAAGFRLAPSCDGPYKGKELHVEAFLELIDRHKNSRSSDRLDVCGIDMSRWPLQGADLSNLNLILADFSEADLSRADFSGSWLQGAKINRARIEGANFANARLDDASISDVEGRGAKFKNSVLDRADFSNSNLTRADLENASALQTDFSRTNLTETSFRASILRFSNFEGAELAFAKLRDADASGASFKSANLHDVDLTDAKFRGADVSGSIFTPLAATLPSFAILGTLRIDDQMRFGGSPQGLYALRQGMKEAGRTDQERALTFAIEESRTKLLLGGSAIHWVQGAMRVIAFDWTVRYGLSPARALLVIVWMIPGFALGYYIALSGRSEAQIYRIWAKDNPLRSGQPPMALALSGRQRIVTALHFSLLSAFQLGWRDVNVGNWLSRLQREEWVMAATGWARSISGIQALLSVYLLAIWVLAQFGRPFE